MKRKINLLTFVIGLLCSIQTIAQSPNSAYTIQENDWLSKVSEKAYQNPHLYHRIIDGTNEKAKSDNSFRTIARPNDLQVGQKVWIPDLTGNSTNTTETTVNTTATSGNMFGVPKTNCEIRLWYNYQVVAVGKINEKWEKDGVDLETRAHKAFELRHEARVNARFMMQSKAEVKALKARDLAKYGNPNGPTFEYLVKKNTDKGLTKEQAYQSIIDSSSRTDTRYNKDCE